MRLYVEEVVLRNFGGLPTEQPRERMIELSSYTEEKLRAACAAAVFLGDAEYQSTTSP